MALTTSQQRFVNDVKKAAVADWNGRKLVVPSMVVAQGILESGYGSSQLAKISNNLFGIKADSRWKGDFVEFNSAEYKNGVRYMKVSKFRKYDSFLDSIKDHNDFLKVNRRYAGLIGQNDYVLACIAIKSAGYATGPTYDASLINLIKSRKYYEIDSYKRTGNEIYKIQLGAFSKRENAENLAKQLKAKGLSTYITQVNGLYKVQLGAYKDPVNLVNQVDILRNNYHITDFFVVRQ